MSEEDIKRIEKKVDLLYKILLESDVVGYVDYLGHPYNQKYGINKFMDELIPLFGLSAVEADLDIPPILKETLKELKSKLETELSRLQNIYKSGNFLAKDEDIIKNKIADITDYLECWDLAWDESGVVEGIFKTKDDIMYKIKQIHERSLFMDLEKKLGLDIDTENVYISYEDDYSGERKRINLIEKRDTLIKNLKELIEKLRNLGEVNN